MKIWVIQYKNHDSEFISYDYAFSESAYKERMYTSKRDGVYFDDRCTNLQLFHSYDNISSMLTFIAIELKRYDRVDGVSRHLFSPEIGVLREAGIKILTYLGELPI